MRVRLTFIEQLLATKPGDEDIYKTYIASRGPDAKTIKEEIEAHGIDKVMENGMSVFDKTPDGKPMLWDYQIKGFFKDACGSLQKVPGSPSSKDEFKSYKKSIGGLIFITPRMIPINGAIEEKPCVRPIMINGPQGERTAIAVSQTVPAGSTIEFEITMLDQKKLEPLVKAWLDYGKLRGIGQWRNSGKGRFTWEEVDRKG